MSSADPDSAARGSSTAPGASPGLDPLETVRRHPEWYFGGGHFDRAEAIGLLVAEASRGGATEISVRSDDGWVVVTADVDWLDGDLAAFVSPQTDPAGGVNSARVEVALVAFCDAVLTATADGSVHHWSGSGRRPVGAAPQEWLGASGRLVAFLPPADQRATASRSPASTKPRLRLVTDAGQQEIATAVTRFIEKQSGSTP